MAPEIFPGKSSIGVVMPMYVDEQKRSERNLRSALNDITVITLSSVPGMKRAEPFRGRFRDLVRYGFNITGEALDYHDLGRKITESLASEYNGIGVSFLVDALPVELFEGLKEA